ncbi:MAG: nitroreductase [Rhizobiaceae bacterium]
MNELLEYMKSRRSSLSLTLEEPGPNETELRTILEIASRVPDHGKLAPWRFVLWTPTFREEVHKKLSQHLKLKFDTGVEENERSKQQKGLDKILHAPCVIAVVSKAVDGVSVPCWEQELSAGAVCMNTLIAANALNFEAQWLTGWFIYDEDAKPILGLDGTERIAGLIHIGTSKIVKSERPRPDVSQIFTVR